MLTAESAEKAEAKRMNYGNEPVSACSAVNLSDGGG